MRTRQLVVVFIETIIKVVVLIIIIRFVFKYASNAYDFGYRVFAEKPVSASEGRTITIAVKEGDSVEAIGEMLENKGLIRDSALFRVQEMLSAYHGEIKPGIYDLNTSMTAEEMLEIMSEEKEVIPSQESETAEPQEDSTVPEDEAETYDDDFQEGGGDEG